MIKHLDLLVGQALLAYVPLVADFSMIVTECPSGDLERAVQGGLYFATGFVAERIFVGLRNLRNSNIALEEKRDGLEQAQQDCMADCYRNYTLH